MASKLRVETVRFEPNPQNPSVHLITVLMNNNTGAVISVDKHDKNTIATAIKKVMNNILELPDA